MSLLCVALDVKGVGIRSCIVTVYPPFYGNPDLLLCVSPATCGRSQLRRIPPTKRPGSVVVTRPASHGEVPGSNPGLVVLFSLTD